MYPLVIIFLVGLAKKNRDIHLYVLPFSIVGGAIAIYHNLLYYNIIPESIVPCINGVSCTTKFVEWFGFVTIPLLSFIAFTVINVAMILYLKRKD
jgi:disulfide bond formation protein DsbB